ncbi:S-methyl-5-thioribose-1-phosphate isomerase [Vampirovibrio chlorellavorus]|uniref:S-methyl-5-thioribose-1-phosphate isomerase n=1 Tax=Vampirovibrio chlorellavorus TaxID=758823 RepID=UPI0026EB2CEB|nr:S-methyl-5-thioribose-1-phosphate isomerase [Vampirovibrio chlorellavorus]
MDTLSPALKNLSSRVQALELMPDGVRLLDQTALPNEVRYLTIRTAGDMADAIVTMLVRGAPAIGIAGAYGVVLSARESIQKSLSFSDFKRQLLVDVDRLSKTRPTAVNLFWALNAMQAVIDEPADIATEVLERLTAKALQIHQEDWQACQAMGQYGAALVPKGAGILTHCNAGALATGGYGTALGVIRSAYANDPTIRVYADETRPRLQGARLTTWELVEDGIPVTLISDNMSGSLMRDGKIQFVVVGADRITANGDTANKIGTYNLAIIAQAHQVPFYVAAPLSTIDLSLATGQEIPIEERDASEISTINNELICAKGVNFYNPSFDVTPASYIAGIITEKGIARPPFQDSLAQLFKA